MSGLCPKIMSQHIVPEEMKRAIDNHYLLKNCLNKLLSAKNVMKVKTVTPVTLYYFIRYVNYGQISKSHHLV